MTTGPALQVTFGYSDVDEHTTASIGASVAVNQNTPTADNDQSVHVGAGNDLGNSVAYAIAAGLGNGGVTRN